MLSSNTRKWILGAAAAALLIIRSHAVLAADNDPPHRNTNINLAVASNFYGVPPSNSAITDNGLCTRVRCL
jgi:hypothetical protein